MTLIYGDLIQSTLGSPPNPLALWGAEHGWSDQASVQLGPTAPGDSVITQPLCVITAQSSPWPLPVVTAEEKPGQETPVELWGHRQF